MTETPKIGELLPADEHRRDAIHVAVCPMTAAEELGRGEWVGVRSDGTVYGCLRDDPECVGIVDPFLGEILVHQGARIFVFLKPGTVTSLRHVWTHPALDRQPRTPGGA